MNPTFSNRRRSLQSWRYFYVLCLQGYSLLVKYEVFFQFSLLLKKKFQELKYLLNLNHQCLWINDYLTCKRTQMKLGKNRNTLPMERALLKSHNFQSVCHYGTQIIEFHFVSTTWVSLNTIPSYNIHAEHSCLWWWRQHRKEVCIIITFSLTSSWLF